jgi:molecular chaperone GrpE (heat shock protein)
MRSINIEILMGHNIGVSGSYYKPTEKEVLINYLKIMDQLIINDEFRLSQQVHELKEKNQDSEYVIKGRLQEKDEQIKVLMAQVEKLSNETNRNRQEFIDIAKQNLATIILN